MVQNELLEQLAEIEHDRWSDWMKWMVACSKIQDDGSMLVPADKMNRWRRQMNTPYEELSDIEKASDRREVMRYYHLIIAK